MTDPAQELLAYMAEYELHPKTITFNHRIQRFKVPGDKGSQKSGWVRSFSDQRGAVFGSYRTGVHETWQLKNGKKPTAAEREEWDRLAKERLEDDRRRHAAAAVKAAAQWEGADKADPKHPYLAAKGIGTRGLRQVGDKLIAPMRNEDGDIVSLQSIDGDGNKRFFVDGWIKGTMASIGSKAAPRDIIYITEGWATGYTINAATGAPTAVAYYADNLEAIAKRMRAKFPDSRIVIAADNDHWSKVMKGRNPGVIAARHAAESTGALVAIPEFTGDDVCRDQDCPKTTCDKAHWTDFNDLLLAEGTEAVLRHLLAPQEDQHSVDVAPPKKGKEKPVVGTAVSSNGVGWTTDPAAPFRCLGHDRDTYYYLPRGGGQITERTVGQHDERHLRNMADFAWWAHNFPNRGNNPVDWRAAADVMFRVNHELGIFHPGKVRGRGAWPEDTAEGAPGVLLHLGDQLLPAGASAFVAPETYKCRKRRIYEQLGALDGPHRKETMELDEARTILGLFEDLHWMDPASAYLLAGWAALAPMCGALTWRPHVWVTGGSGSGKTAIIKYLVLPLLGGRRQDRGMAEYVEGGTTEPGIRAYLGPDARPVIYDEADRDDHRSDSRIQAVLSLARSSASSGAAIQKGSSSGKGVSYEVRSMFMLSSIAGSLRQEADKTRVSILQLDSVPRDEEGREARRAHWKRYYPRLKKITATTGQRLMSRTLAWLRDGRMAATVETMRTEAGVVLGDARSGDQYGTLFAGAWSLMADEVPDAAEARELLASHSLMSYLMEQAPEGERVLRKLLQHTVRIDRAGGAPTTHAVGELIEAATPGSISKLHTDAVNFLKMIGIRCDVDDGEVVVVLANTSEWVAEVLRESMYADSWAAALRALPGVRAGKGAVRFHSGLNSRATVMPMTTMGVV